MLLWRNPRRAHALCAPFGALSRQQACLRIKLTPKTLHPSQERVPKSQRLPDTSLATERVVSGSPSTSFQNVDMSSTNIRAELDRLAIDGRR